jgi:hypothetical protein
MPATSSAIYRYFAFVLLLFVVAAFPCFAQVKIYIQPDNGFEAYVSAAITKKSVPAVVVSDADAARFILQPTPVDV